LKAKVTGRLSPGIVYAVTTTWPAVLPSPSRTGMALTVAVYFSVLPLSSID